MSLATRTRSRASRPGRGNANIGVKPTNSQKLIYVANKLKLPGIADMQGSTVNLFDTVLIASNATARQTFTFFENTQNKSRNFSNFQNGVLSTGEAMVMETVKFFLVKLSASNLTLDSTQITLLATFSAGGNAIFLGNKQALHASMISISIANSTVIKDYQINETNPDANPKTTGVTSGIDLTAGLSIDDIHGQSNIDLESPPVLPPNQKFKVTLEVPPLTGVASNVGIMCCIGKFGSIFSAKVNL